jgi:hypothetical protein
MNLPDPSEASRLQILYDNAVKSAREVNQRTVQATLDIAKEKTQYIEKIALANAGTIALVVSFVGSHSGKLQPPWLLRLALVALFVAMISAMFRNWIYPFYLYAVHARQDFIAKREKEQCRLAFAKGVPALSLQDGNPIDVAEVEANVKEADEFLAGAIAKARTRENRALDAANYSEWISLVLTVTGMTLLIALAWLNF